MTEVFVEQPLDSPGSANNNVEEAQRKMLLWNEGISAGVCVCEEYNVRYRYSILWSVVKGKFNASMVGNVRCGVSQLGQPL